MAQEFVELIIKNGAVRYGGLTFVPRVKPELLERKAMMFGLYYEPVDSKQDSKLNITAMRWDSSKIAMWGTPEMYRIMTSKGWPSQWRDQDLALLRTGEGMRLGLLFWHPVQERT